MTDAKRRLADAFSKTLEETHRLHQAQDSGDADAIAYHSVRVDTAYQALGKAIERKGRG